MRHATTLTWRAPLKRAYNTHLNLKCPRYPPAHPFPEHLKLLIPLEEVTDQVTVD